MITLPKWYTAELGAIQKDEARGFELYAELGAIQKDEARDFEL